GDYVECNAEPYLRYGLTGPQRQQLRELMIGYWKSGDGAAQQAILADLKAWDAAARLPYKEREKYIRNNKSRYYRYTQTKTQSDAERNWLNSVVARMRQRYDFLMQIEGIRHQMGMNLATWDVGSTRWVEQEHWNARDRRYEYRWVERPR